MKICARTIAAFILLCSGPALKATPLLFVDFSEAPTDFAVARAGALALPSSTTGDLLSVELTGKSVVIMPGNGWSDRLAGIESFLSSFVQEGGYLWINLAGSACAPNGAPGGAGFVSWSCGGTSHNSETIANPDHQYFTGAFAPQAAHALTATDFLDWDFTDGGHLVNLPQDATVLLSNSKGASLAEYGFGKGWVVVSTLTYGWGQNGARTAAMDNMLLYAASQTRGSAIAEPGPIEGVAEPGTMTLLASGGALLLFARRQRNRSRNV